MPPRTSVRRSAGSARRGGPDVSNGLRATKRPRTGFPQQAQREAWLDRALKPAVE